MSDRTKIEWTRSDDGTPGATWNPVTGCTKLSPASPGCQNCYASTFAERFRGAPGHYFERGFDVQLRPEKLDQPLRWRKPRRIFVNSMSDLFHDDVPTDFIAKVFAIMALAPQHTFQVLTKRHARMRSLLSADYFRAEVHGHAAWWADHLNLKLPQPHWPLPNVWLGVSTENQRWADIRIPALLDTPAAVRFISAEPLLGSIDLRQSFAKWVPPIDHQAWATADKTKVPGGVEEMLRVRDVLHWVIVGGESGPGARPMHPDWARALRDQCTAAGVPFLFKQHGEYVEATEPVPSDRWLTGDGITHDEPWHPDQIGAPAGKWSPYPDVVMRRVGKKAAGRELDGQTWDQYPAAVTA